MKTTDALSASVQVKKGCLYAVIQDKENGKPKAVWRSLGLSQDASKTLVKKTLREVVNKYEEERRSIIERGNDPVADMDVFNYLEAYLEKAKKNLQTNTYEGYRVMLNGRIKKYFSQREDLTVGNLRVKDIKEFYDSIYDDGACANTVIHYHALLRRAFNQAFKDEIIDSNPFDRIERPKKNKYLGDHYSEDELITLLNLTRDDSIYPAIVLGGGLGLRRSEALGVRWSRIDWEKKTVQLDTKVIEYSQNGKKVAETQEVMKNASSNRTLPLPVPVIEMLTEQKEKQEMYKKCFKGSYSKKYEDYVCTNQLGEIILPSQVTRHFAFLLEKNGLRKIRYHDLRHTFASILIGQDVPLINVSNFLGHSDISTTANIYAHLDKASKQASADVISNIFNTEKNAG